MRASAYTLSPSHANSDGFREAIIFQRGCGSSTLEQLPNIIFVDIAMCGNNKKMIILQYITKSILVVAMFNDSSLSFFSPGRRAANYREEGNVLTVFCASLEDLLPDNVIFRFHMSSRWSLINLFWILNHFVESFDLSILISQSNPVIII